MIQASSARSSRPGFCNLRVDRAMGTVLGTSIYNDTAVVVLPAAGHGTIRAKDLRRWLARSDLEFSEEPSTTLSRVTRAIGHPQVTSGLGALRLWGQTGDRPTVWMAAADPVYLEPRLDHLCLHELSAHELSSRDLGELFDELQSELGGDGALGFVHVARCGYLRGPEPMPTAALSARRLHGRELSPFMPSGKEAGAYHRIHSEIQMAIHLSGVHRRREAQGLRPINALWIWGGGASPDLVPRGIPPLFADDPVLRGYWNSAAGVVQPWNGKLADCVEHSPEGFVAVVPKILGPSPDGADALSGHLADLRAILGNSDIRVLTLLFEDGVTAVVRRRHRWRFWRRRAAGLETAPSP